MFKKNDNSIPTIESIDNEDANGEEEDNDAYEEEDENDDESLSFH